MCILKSELKRQKKLTGRPTKETIWCCYHIRDFAGSVRIVQASFMYRISNVNWEKRMSHQAVVLVNSRWEVAARKF